MPCSNDRTLWLPLIGLTALVLLVPVGLAQDDAAPPRIKIDSLDDLPRHAYKIDGTVSGALQSEEALTALAGQLRADMEDDLAKYQIDDAKTLQELYSTLSAIAMLDGRYDEGVALIEKMRALEDKEAARLMTGLTTRALVAAERGAARGTDAYRRVFREELAASVGALPWDVVQDTVKQRKARAEILSETLLLGMVQGQFDPVAAQTGEISADIAGNVVRMAYVLRLQIPLADEIIGVYGDVIDQHQVVKQDIWPDRALALESGRGFSPVTLAIWDSGVDPTVFVEQMFYNPGERYNGTDSDGNGYVDDVNGIAFDLDGRRSPAVLCPLGDAAARIDGIMEHMKGFLDLQAAVASPEASALKRHLAGLRAEEVNGFLEDLMLGGQYMHGTHVAGIALEGNPYARLLSARIMFDHRSIPRPLTLEIAARFARAYVDTVRYFKQRGVRVANMSWGWSLKEIESGLEKSGFSGTAEQRATLASRILGILRTGLRVAMASAPEILFVSAAGNEDNDVAFDEVIPSSIELPNLLIVGAVDQAGEPTSFTSSGQNVVVYANGFEVDSYIPGGARMKSSGTSMASPNVVNLAAKLLVLKPELTPTELIELIKSGADRKTGKLSYLLLNPKRSAGLLREEQ